MIFAQILKHQITMTWKLKLAAAACLLYLVPACDTIENTTGDNGSQSGETVDDNPGTGTDPDGTGQPEEAVKTLIYYDNLDREKANEAYYLDQGSGFVNATGPGAAGTAYSGQGISVRSSYSSRGYDGASGVNALNFGFDNRKVLISGITLAPGQNVLEFSFGATPPSGKFSGGESLKLYVDFDNGSDMAHELEYTVVQGTSTWGLATAVFEITGGTPSNLSFTLLAKDKSTKVDDFRLMATTARAEQSIAYKEKADYKWAEMPEAKVQNPAYKYVTHYTTTVVSKKTVRNYSACYDTERHNPVWVAYPCHACYTEGWGRTSPDPWRPDPMFNADEQSVIYPSDWEDWPWDGSEGRPRDKYYYWSNLSWDSNGFTKGHLLRSDDRRGAGEEINIQTFYPTNIAPEEFLYPDIHAQLESLLSENWVCSDTVYVVSGCWYDSSAEVTVHDASNWSDQSELSKECVVPDYQFKLYLRTRSGSTGKAIQECRADELMAIGFWLPQNLDGAPTVEGGDIADFARSVDKIEELTGEEFEFFPEAPDEVKASYNLSDWGL